MECPVKHPRVSTRGIFKMGFKHRKHVQLAGGKQEPGENLTVRIHFFKKTSKFGSVFFFKCQSSGHTEIP